MISSSCTTCGTRPVYLVTNPVISHEWGKDRKVFTTSGTYPWSFVTQIFRNDKPSHGGMLWCFSAIDKYFIFLDLSCGDKTLNVLCGFGGSEKDEEKKKALEEHIKMVQSLKQDPCAKIILRIGMVIILAIGTFLYFFWSYWKYEP